MDFLTKVYSVLVVSSGKMDEALKSILPAEKFGPVVFAGSVAEAKRRILDRPYDIVIIVSPLPDEFGSRFAIDISEGRSSVCLMIIKADMCEEINAKVSPHGVFTLPRPTSAAVMTIALRWLISARERVASMQKDSQTLEQKMEDIRVVNRAKWVLIESLGMSEPDAHRYIEKQAMNSSLTKRAVAEEIIRTYKM